MVGKWHLCPDDEMNLASTRRNWPSGRGFERWYGFLGAETSQWYPDLVYDNHPVDQPQVARGGLPPHRRPHRQGDRVHHGREGDRAGEAVLPLLRARRLPRAAPRAEGVDRQVQGPVRHGLRGDARADARPPEGARASSRRTPSCRRSTRSGRPRRAPGPTASRSRRWTSRGRGTRSRTTRSSCSAGWPRSTPGSSRTPTTRSAGCSTSSRSPAGARTRSWSLVSDNGASRRGRPERLGQRDEVRERHPRQHRGQPAAARRPRQPEDVQPLPERLGDGVQHAVQDVEALRVQRRHERPVHHLVAGRDEGQGRDPRRSTTTRSTSCPTILDVLGVEPPETIKGHVQSRFDGVSMRYSFDDATAPSTRHDAVLLDARLAGDLARRLEGRHEPPDDQRLEPLQRRRVGAVPHRRRPLRAAQPRRRAPREGPRAREPLVRRGRRERGVPARRPLGARDHPHAAAGALAAARTATSTSRTRPRCPSRRRSTSATARSRSARWSTSRRRAPQGVLFAHGSRFGGHALYVKDNRLHYVYNFVGMVEQKVVATEDLPTGENLILSASFDKDGEDPPGVATGIALALPRRQEGRRGPRSRPSPASS